MLNCTDCGNELAEANLEAQFDLPAEITEEWELEIEGGPTERFQDTDKNGKPIKPRYQKHFYGADLTLTATPPEGSKAEKQEFSCSVEEQASGFEQLN